MEMDLTSVISAVIGFLVGILSFYAWQAWIYFRSSKNELLKIAVEAACEAAEKAYKGEGRGKEKLEFALEFVEAMLKEWHIHFNVAAVTELINKYVEDAFNSMHKEPKVG